MKNWLRCDAELLRGNVKLPAKPRINGRTIADLPVEQIVRMMPSRLHPQRAAKFSAIIGYEFTESGRQFTFHVRRGIGEIAPGLDERCELIVRATEDDFKRILVAADVKPLSAEFWRRVSVRHAAARRAQPLAHDAIAAAAEALPRFSPDSLHSLIPRSLCFKNPEPSAMSEEKGIMMPLYSPRPGTA